MDITDLGWPVELKMRAPLFVGIFSLLSSCSGRSSLLPEAVDEAIEGMHYKRKVPLKVKAKIKVRTWSGHGQVRSGQVSNLLIQVLEWGNS